VSLWDVEYEVFIGGDFKPAFSYLSEEEKMIDSVLLPLLRIWIETR